MPTDPHSVGETLRTLLTIAWLLPLGGFAIEVLGGWWGGRRNRAASYIAVACIGVGFVLSTAALVIWGQSTHWDALAAQEVDHGAHAEEGHAEESHNEHGRGDGEHAEDKHATSVFSGTFYTLARFDDLVLSLDYYIDSLTLVMFVMVTLIATCIHVFAIGYMSDELTEDHVDHEVHLASGKHLHRPGRFYTFFSYMSLFSFSMLGLVLAGNIFQVFVFWELVGICSYLLIGFYVERKSASTAANKAFIMNRVGDFGFLIGLMVLWTYFGTFRFVENPAHPGAPGLFEMVRGGDGSLDVGTEDGVKVVYLHGGEHEHSAAAANAGDAAAEEGGTGRLAVPYMLLVVAGLGIFAGCVGKSAQFPLQTWLPDAMEGPTPVSALVHSATMVAAGVYLAGRFYPMFTPEVLLVIAYVGCITLFLAATIAIVATDIKRVLAYSTISQLGYMMLGIGVGGWVAGLFHLITHAFFKSLMFLASGSVIVGCHHEQEMPRMGGLWRKMPITAFTMLVGVIAISGLVVPGLTVFGYKLAFSGHHSKDLIVATSLGFNHLNPAHFLLFLVPLVTAGLTAFYMFRLWFYTFAGEPRDQELYDHAHESPWVMTGPLILLSVFAALIAFDGESITRTVDGAAVERPGVLFGLLEHSQPIGVHEGVATSDSSPIALPAAEFIHGHVDATGAHVEHAESSPHATAGLFATLAAFTGMILAWVVYGLRLVNPADVKRQFAGLHGFLVEKWQFDRMYDVMFVHPTHVVAGWCAWFDRVVLDGVLHGLSRATVKVSEWDRRFDEGIIDGLVNLLGDATYSVGGSLRRIQTGQLRQYIMFIAVGVLTLFVLLFAFFPR